MAINFPATPQVNDTYTVNNTTWKYDGTVWNVVQSDTARTIFTTVAGDTGSATADIVDDTITIEGGTNVTTSVAGKTLTINSSGATQNLFATITSDDGSTTADSATDTLSILGGTNIATNIATDTDNVTVNMTSFSIDFLSDVDTTSTSPVTGNVLKWNGTNWAPGVDATTITII